MSEIKKRRRRGGIPTKEPVVSDEELNAILEASKARNFPRDWLIMRLIMEWGLSSGEICGRFAQGTKMQGIHLRDLTDDHIMVHRHGSGESKYVHPELIHIEADLVKNLEGPFLSKHVQTVCEWTV